MSLHDRLKFNKGLKQKISDKNRNFFTFKKWLENGGANYPDLFLKSILIVREVCTPKKR